MPGTYSSLETLDAGYFLVLGGEFYDPEGDLQETFNPQRYKLTLLDGSYFIYDQDVGGVTESGDANGNSVSWEGNAIRHSTGQGLSFARDPENRITAVSDGKRSVQYRYDVLGNLQEVTDANGNPTRFKYGPDSYLNEIIDARGVRATRTEYDDEGRVVRQINADGDTLRMNHDLDNNTEVVEDFKGQVTTYAYDLRGNVLSKTDDVNNTWFYGYDSADNLIETAYPGGTFRSSTFDGKGNELTTTDELNHTTTRTFDGLGKVLTSTDPLSRTTRYEYDDAGNLLKETGPDMTVQSERTHDAQGNVLTEKDALGNLTTNVYRQNGWIRYRTDALDRTTAFGYNPLTGEVVEEVDPRGNRMRYAYDNNGNRILTVNALGDTSRTEYNAINKLVKETDARGNATRYVYNNLGDKVEDIAADGSAITRAYDPMGNTASITDQVGRVTRMEYDHENRVTKTVFNDSSFVRSEYDALGRRTRSLDANGNVTQYGYDDAGRNITVTDALGHVTRFEYDDTGRKTAMVDALNQRTEYGYDAYDRQVTTTFHDGSTKGMGYDAAGRKISETDQENKTTGFEYDDAGNLTAVVDALNHRTEYSYDENNNRISQKDANLHTTTMSFDALNKMVSRTYPNGDQERWTYDGNGNTLGYVKGVDSTAYAYDAVNREAFRKHFPSGHEVRITYTADGRQDSVIDYRGVTLFAYDNRGRLAAEEMPNGDFIESNYDAHGNRVRMATPFDTTHYSFDALNRMDSVISKGQTTVYRYNAAGHRDSVENPNGTAVGYSFDNLNRLTEVRNWSGLSLLSRFTYTLNDAGIRAVVDELDGSHVAFSYDDLYRLTGEVRTGSNPYNNGFSYDNVGNRLTQVQDGVTITYTYNNRDQLESETSSSGTATYSYDLAGRQTGKTDASGATTFTWEDGDRLAFISGSGINVQYEYDSEGRRVKETAPTETKQYLIDPILPYGQVIAETDGAGSLTSAYTYGLERISQERGGVTHFYLADGQGSIRQLTDTAGVVTDTWLYSAFGELLDRTGTTENRFTYTGEEYDPNAGFLYLRQRWMNPTTGQFISVDPFEGDPQTLFSLHRYLYAGANPIGNVDPSGETFISVATSLAIQGLISAAISSSITWFSTRSVKQTVISGVGGFALGAAVGGVFYAVKIFVTPAVPFLIHSNKLSYLLNPDLGKAKGFELLGYSLNNPQALEKMLAGTAQLINQEKAVISTVVTQYGKRVTVQAAIVGPNGAPGIVTVGWFLDDGKNVWRLVTAIPKPLKAIR